MSFQFVYLEYMYFSNIFLYLLSLLLALFLISSLLLFYPFSPTNIGVGEIFNLTLDTGITEIDFHTATAPEV